MADDPLQIYYFQTIHVVDLPPAPTTAFERVLLDPEVTVLQLAPPPEEWALTAVGEQCMGLVLSLDCVPLETKLASIPVWESSAHFGRSRLCRIASDHNPVFDKVEKVSLCLRYSWQSVKTLRSTTKLTSLRAQSNTTSPAIAQQTPPTHRRRAKTLSTSAGPQW